MQIQKKKKRKQETFILQNVYNEDSEEIMDSENQITVKIKKTMSQHIGIENSISPADLFYAVFNTRPQELNFYKRNYWWNILKKEMRELRRNNEIFTIIKGSKCFVLKDELELQYYLKMTKNHIKSIKNMQKNAREWVKKKKWSKL